MKKSILHLRLCIAEVECKTAICGADEAKYYDASGKETDMHEILTERAEENMLVQAQQSRVVRGKGCAGASESNKK